MRKKITFANAINQAIESAIKKDNKVVLMGLGVDDPKGVFGTTLNIHKKYKKNVFDMPTAENALTGIGLGLAISKFKPIIVHQRVEFSLLSVEQIFNQIAKWFYMSGGKVNVPIVIRLIIGRGWGQGPQHSQSLEAIFSHIPGLKVVCPSNAYDAKGLLLKSIFDPDPVIFFEHRWLHQTLSFVPEKNYLTPIGKAKIVNKGKDITIITFSYGVIECLKSLEFLKNHNIDPEIIDLRSLRPLDTKKIINSAKKTKKVLIVDNGMIKNGISAEVAAVINENCKDKIIIKRIGVVDSPIPSSPSIAKFAYPNKISIIKNVFNVLNLKKKIDIKEEKIIGSDQPDKYFTGPF